MRIGHTVIYDSLTFVILNLFVIVILYVSITFR